MPQPDTDRLKAIKSLPQLVAYLRDELDWPIESAEPEEILFDYAPGELGLDTKAAVNIKEIRQLRPLAGNQPWGIFFVNFEKKQLPVSVMRLILRALVFKKRASANKADRQAWQPHDLLFVSSCGTDNNRSISFAHFVENKETELSELRVLGWDDDDTPLHMDYVSRILHEKLGWDAKLASNPEEWRTRWSEAFLLKHRHTITKADELAEALAELATKLRNRLRTLLKYEDGHGEIRRLQRAFEVGLIHDLNDESFADMFAQTVTYGLFSVSVRRTFPGEGTAVTKDDPANLIFTSPFLKEMLGVFLGLKSRKGKIDFDQLGISDVTDLLNSPDTHMDVVLADFNNKTRGEDPVIHFYEHFLSSYNKKLKVERGVFYTPQPVVSYIVRSVHELLQTEFGLADGLADTTTWGEMLKKHPGLKLPPLTDEPDEKRTISPDEPFVQILDPATGTATFLVEVIDVIHRTLVAKWKEQRLNEAQQRAAWNDYVPKHLLPRLHAFELMMAPYAIAHMKIGLKLAETGYRFGIEERARIYLTNALEPKVKQLPTIGYAPLAREAKEVNEIKWYKRFTVVIGNPPYSNFGQLNKNHFILGLLDDYKRGLNEQKLNLDDDYIKFIRYCQHVIEQTGVGTFGMITNNVFYDGVTHRRMRESLLNTYSNLRFLDLHGSTKKLETSPDGSRDDNVFDIQQGVGISLFTKQPQRTKTSTYFSELWGIREAKYKALASFVATWDSARELENHPPYFFFTPKDFSGQGDWDRWHSIRELMPVSATGVKTHIDNVLVGFAANEIEKTVETFLRETWKSVPLAQTIRASPLRKAVLIKNALKKNSSNPMRRYAYRALDNRKVLYLPEAIEAGDHRYPVMRHLLGPNIALATVRQLSQGSFAHVLVTRSVADMCLLSTATKECAYIFPLRLASEDQLPGVEDGRLNLSAPLQAYIKETRASPEDYLAYVYALLHSAIYRERYAEFLKIDFPRLPLTGNVELFSALARLGGELTALHLLESQKLDKQITEFIGAPNSEVEKVSWSNNTVWIDKAQTVGFKGVREDVWNFHIGGYQVCEKWLKDRKDRKLSKDDITHYQKVIVALSDSIRLMKEIDEVIKKHGGWPGAFLNSQETAPKVSERAEANKEDESPPTQQSFL